MSTKSDDNDVFYAILLVALVLPSILWRGFVIAKLWAWFVVPLGVVEISAWHAAGLSGLIAWVADSTAYRNAKDDKKTAGEQFAYACGMALLAPLLAWAMGAVVHAFM